jgi:hypothetical protein
MKRIRLAGSVISVLSNDPAAAGEWVVKNESGPMRRRRSAGDGVAKALDLLIRFGQRGLHPVGAGQPHMRRLAFENPH